jgi:translation initiation factor 2B subunit (eIF-2B alpha/beta/delta family)
LADAVVRDLIANLAGDTSSGAAELAGQGAAVLTALAESTEVAELASFMEQVVETGRLLIRSQPSMAPLFNLVNSVLWSLEHARNLADAREKVGQAAEDLTQELVSAGEKIAAEAVGLIAPGATLLIHSRSSTVLRALLHVRSEGRHFGVICTESRPLYEGRTLAEELSRADIPTTLVTEAEIGLVVERVDVMIVGADAVSLKGLVNKAGTYGLALVARAHERPVYSLCGTQKFLPEQYPYFDIERKDPAEVWPAHPPEVTVLNYYFDLTPLRYVSSLVTEEGPLQADELEQRLDELRIHEMLLGVGKTGRIEGQ